jgi:hypothetical protein
MKFKKFLDEALKPSQFREYVKIWKKYGVKKLTDHAFGNKDRIYEPYKDMEKEISNNQKEIEKILSASDYVIKDYQQGLLYNTKTKRELKIVKYLDSLIKKTTNNEEREKLNIIKKNFINDKSRSLAGKKLLICYTRHPYDVAGMSTDRGWTSCMELPNKTNFLGGCNYHLLSGEIKYGTIVAYLIEENDKNLKNPIGRVAIKPYYHIETDFNKPDDIIWVPAKIGYGTTPPTFIKQVEKWVEEHLNNVSFEEITGIYQLPQDIDQSDVMQVFVGPGTTIIKTFTELLDYIDEFRDAYKKIINRKIYFISDNVYFDMDNIIYTSSDERKIILDLCYLIEDEGIDSIIDFLDKYLKIEQTLIFSRDDTLNIFLIVLKQLKKEYYTLDELMDIFEDNPKILRFLKKYGEDIVEAIS